MSTGIPVHSNGRPVHQTILVAPNFQQAQAWAGYSAVNLRAPNILYVSFSYKLEGFWAAEWDLVTYNYVYDIDLVETLHLLNAASGPWRKSWYFREAHDIRAQVVD